MSRRVKILCKNVFMCADFGERAEVYRRKCAEIAAQR